MEDRDAQILKLSRESYRLENDLCSSRVDVDTTAILVEADATINQRKEGVILPTPNSLTRVPLGATLTNEDVSSDDFLATKLLHTTALTLAVAPVLNTALTFLMSHILKVLKL